MTREEEITQAAKEIARKWYYDPNNETAYIAARQGMLWSDEHPKPNLVDIDKAVEWLKSLDFEIYNEQKKGLYIWYTIFNKDKFIESFKQAMKEE